MSLTDQQWLSAVIAASVALTVYVLGVRSTARGRRFEELSRATVRLNDAAIALASEVSRLEGDRAAPADTRDLHREVRAAAAAVQLATQRRDILLRSSIVVRTAWQMRRAVQHPDDDVSRWPWWRFAPDPTHADGARCASCPSGVRPPAALLSARIRTDPTVRRMNRLLDDLNRSVAGEVARAPFTPGDTSRHVVARLLQPSGRWRPGARAGGAGAAPPAVRGVAWRRWWRELPDRIRHRGAPDRDQLDEWLRHYGCLSVEDPKPSSGAVPGPGATGAVAAGR
ncbi:hypothetical protein H9657_07475 [Cellulomonas sp. Sa3CUA2]|uniref:Signal transduction histidine kinase subgroup 3 dimerisation and phosphoacceptor domain-containing protein n=1 Tax=Cellulomonas avistercoris TaxID=2762242 RepID=A0ABR8QCH1_9CELL|nr:hypothetical protein [Cellulomonas avistercoris]MBD7918117.1 hypothetical protein [Cellulomonas avistercoris]